MRRQQAWKKRGLDIFAALCGLVICSWLIMISFIVAMLDTKRCGFFLQTRVGKNGRHFKVIKIRTMRDVAGINTTVTANGDQRITNIGAFFRRTKIDELPQLINVLLGQMSLVGPRPDVPSFYDQLPDDVKRILFSVRPGITGPATLKYRAEEQMLSVVDDPETYNRDVIFPDKVRINLEYVERYSFARDLKYIWATVFHIRYLE